MIPFNCQNIFGKELEYIEDAYASKKISGDGKYTSWCHQFLEKRFQTSKALLTTSCTHALEMAMLMLGLKEGDEVIVPSYTFVSTVNAIALTGAKPVFIDIRNDTLNMDERQLEGLITPRTKAVMPIHYAGVGCEMDVIMEVARKHGIYVVEDAAQGLNAKYRGRYLGTIGDLGCFSFHETKNVSMGEGGALFINDRKWVEQAEITREKGTNRSKFFRGEVDKYTWVGLGSSYLPSDINAAVLRAQLEHLPEIQEKRRKLFDAYHEGLAGLEKEGRLRRPFIPGHCTANQHMYYLLVEDIEVRTNLIEYLKKNGIHAVFHYVPLHNSPYARKHYGEISLPRTEDLSSRLLRLPMYYSLERENVDYIIDNITSFYRK